MTMPSWKSIKLIKSRSRSLNQCIWANLGWNCLAMLLRGFPNSRAISHRKQQIQFSHSITAPVARTSAGTWLYKQPMITYQQNKSSTSMIHEAYESKLRSVVRSSMHPCQGNWLAIGRAVMHHARDAHTFSAGIKSRHCTYVGWRITV